MRAAVVSEAVVVTSCCLFLTSIILGQHCFYRRGGYPTMSHSGAEVHPHAHAYSEVGNGRPSLPLPPLPDPIPPTTIQGQRLVDIYDVIRSLRREIDDPASHDTILEMLSEDHSTLKAVATVLHQSGALIRKNANGEMSALPVPPCAAPPLLPGYTSWIVDSPAGTTSAHVDVAPPQAPSSW